MSNNRLKEFQDTIEEKIENLDKYVSDIRDNLERIENQIYNFLNYDIKSPLTVQIQSNYENYDPVFKFGQMVKIKSPFYKDMIGKVIKVIYNPNGYTDYVVRINKKDIQVDANIAEEYLEKTNAVEYMKEKKNG